MGTYAYEFNDRDAPPDIRQLRPDLPVDWQQFLARLLEKDRAKRFADAGTTRATVLALPVE